MATYYCDSEAAGAADNASPTNGDNWDLPWATFDYAVQQITDNDTLYVASRHRENATGTLNRSLTATEGNDINIISVDRSSGTPPTVYESMQDGGGSINTTTGDSAYTFKFCNLWGLKFEQTNPGGNFDIKCGSDGSIRVYDCHVRCGKGDVNLGIGARSYSYFEGLTLEITGTITTGELLVLSNSGVKTHFKNCRFLYVGPGMSPIVGEIAIGSEQQITFEDCEFDTTLAWFQFIDITGTDTNSTIKFLRCLIPDQADVPHVAAGAFDSGIRIIFSGCGNQYNGTPGSPYEGMYVYQTEGAIKADYTVYRNNGAEDGDGNKFSWQMTADGTDSLTTPSIHRPVMSEPVQVFVPAGARTLTLYVASNAEIDDQTFWAELSSGNEDATPTHYPRTQTSRGTNILGSATNLTTDSVSAWTGGNSVAFRRKIQFSIDPTRDALLSVRFFMAADRTIYVDPQIVEE
jgi:hypothetical protein